MRMVGRADADKVGERTDVVEPLDRTRARGVSEREVSSTICGFEFIRVGGGAETDDEKDGRFVGRSACEAVLRTWDILVAVVEADGGGRGNDGR